MRAVDCITGSFVVAERANTFILPKQPLLRDPVFLAHKPWAHEAVASRDSPGARVVSLSTDRMTRMRHTMTIIDLLLGKGLAWLPLSPGRLDHCLRCEPASSAGRPRSPRRDPFS